MSENKPKKVNANLLFTGLMVGIVGILILSVHWGAVLTPTGVEYPWSPIALGIGLLKGTVWPAATLPIAAMLLITAIGLYAGAMIGLMFLRRRFRRQKKKDGAQDHLGSRNETAVLREKARREETTQLHPDAPDLAPGQKIGLTLRERPRRWILQGWRDLGVFVFGTGRGKTTAMVIRRVIEAPGAAVVTSNKVDGIREVIAGRRSRGQVWIMDGNDIYRHDHARPDFAYNPLWSIRTSAEAKELAAIFEASTRKPGDRGGDPQFDTDGRNLVACMFLAAALEDKPLAQVFVWIAESNGDQARKILRSHGKNGPATNIEAIDAYPDRTRGSVYATAKRMVSALEDDDLLEWTSATDVRRFDPETFVHSDDLLVLLSKDGEGSGSALVTALVRAVCRSGERAAQRNGGRLRTPLVLELDECANTVKWPELPSLYSFYGSMGIIIDCYFQSRAQGIGTFGKEGWQTLWDAASTRGFGGGSGDDEFLQALSKLIGEHEVQTHSSSHGTDGRGSTSTSTRRVSTLDVAALATLPEWRALILTSKAPPVLVELEPWFRDPTLIALITPPDPTPPTPHVTGADESMEAA